MFHSLLHVTYVGSSVEEFDSGPCDTRHQALETAMNLLWAALEDNASLEVEQLRGATRRV